MQCGLNFGALLAYLAYEIFFSNRLAGIWCLSIAKYLRFGHGYLHFTVKTITQVNSQRQIVFSHAERVVKHFNMRGLNRLQPYGLPYTNDCVVVYWPPSITGLFTSRLLPRTRVLYHYGEMILSRLQRCGNVQFYWAIATGMAAHSVTIDKYSGNKITGTDIEYDLFALPIRVVKAAVIPDPLYIRVNGAATCSAVWRKRHSDGAWPVSSVLPTLTHPHAIGVCGKIP